MNELQTAIFASFVNQEFPDCDGCGLSCDSAYRLTEYGTFDDHTQLEGWAYWPHCPRSYQTRYAVGADTTNLRQLIRWELERDTHKKALLSAGASQLFRRYLLQKDLPEALYKHIAAEKSKKARSQ